MIRMSDWWSKKLASQQPHGIRVSPQHHIPQQQQPQQPVHYPQPQQQMVPQAPIDGSKVTYQQLAKEHDGEKISKYWRGGEAMRTEGNLGCPQCGSSTSYTQYSGTAGAAAGIAGNRPRPHCFECGYNGLFQQGEMANWSI